MAVVAVKVIALDKGSQERSGAYLQNRISLLRMRVGTGANLYVNDFLHLRHQFFKFSAPTTRQIFAENIKICARSALRIPNSRI